MQTGCGVGFCMPPSMDLVQYTSGCCMCPGLQPLLLPVVFAIVHMPASVVRLAVGACFSFINQPRCCGWAKSKLMFISGVAWQLNG